MFVWAGAAQGRLVTLGERGAFPAGSAAEVETLRRQARQRQVTGVTFVSGAVVTALTAGLLQWRWGEQEGP
jgi:hypothetical protein